MAEGKAKPLVCEGREVAPGHEDAALLSSVGASSRSSPSQLRLRMVYRICLATTAAAILLGCLALRGFLLPGQTRGEGAVRQPSVTQTFATMEDERAHSGLQNKFSFGFPWFGSGRKSDNTGGFKMITAGTCRMNGMFPITHLTTCEEAAKQLGLEDTKASIAMHIRRPEGCYQAHMHSKTYKQLWIGINPQTQGNGAETSTEKISRHPICASTEEIGSGPRDKKYDSGVGFPVTQSFYVYHAETDTDNSVENINGGDLPGLLWYLHNKVVTECPRKFGITRVRRIKLTMKSTQDLYNDSQTQFGPYIAYWHEKCFSHGCADYHNRYGAVIGCQTLPYHKRFWGAYCRPPGCKPGHLYSLPGPCPEQPFGQKSEACKKEFPGGLCGGTTVTGERGCTYIAEDAGVVTIDEVTGINDYPSFCENGGLEYDQKHDHGHKFNFWNGLNNKWKCANRLNSFLQKFKEKYPDRPIALGVQTCDWRWSKPL